MKKIKLLSIALLAAASTFTFALASEIPENTEIVTENIEETEVGTEEIEDTTNTEEAEETSEEINSEESEITEETDTVTTEEMIESNTETNIEETKPEISTKEEIKKESSDDKKDSNQSEVTQGWLDVTTTITNSTFVTETKITFIFENKTTGEIIEKEFSSLNNFEASIKLPIGEYIVSLENPEYEEFIIYQKELSIEEGVQTYKININSYTDTPQAEDDTDQPKENPFWSILKNNLVFLLILVGCGGYLLYKEIKRRTSDY